VRPSARPIQYIDVAHREHAVVETGGVRTAKAIVAISPDWPWKDGLLTCRQRLCALSAPA